jgi:hypothetical protein
LETLISSPPLTAYHRRQSLRSAPAPADPSGRFTLDTLRPPAEAPVPAERGHETPAGGRPGGGWWVGSVGSGRSGSRCDPRAGPSVRRGMRSGSEVLRRAGGGAGGSGGADAGIRWAGDVGDGSASAGPVPDRRPGAGRPWLQSPARHVRDPAGGDAEPIWQARYDHPRWAGFAPRRSPPP